VICEHFDWQASDGKRHADVEFSPLIPGTGFDIDLVDASYSLDRPMGFSLLDLPPAFRCIEHSLALTDDRRSRAFVCFDSDDRAMHVVLLEETRVVAAATADSSSAADEENMPEAFDRGDGLIVDLNDVARMGSKGAERLTGARYDQAAATLSSMFAAAGVPASAFSSEREEDQELEILFPNISLKVSFPLIFLIVSWSI